MLVSNIHTSSQDSSAVHFNPLVSGSGFRAKMSNSQWMFVLLCLVLLCFLLYEQACYVICYQKSNPLTKENFCQPVLLGSQSTIKLLFGQATTFCNVYHISSY